MIHAVVIVMVIVLAAPLAQNIPLASLAAILLFVAWNMGEWREFVRLKNYSLNYRIILLTTFTLTVLFDLTVAVEVGLLLACLFFIIRMAGLTHLEVIAVPAHLSASTLTLQAYRIVGSLFFGSVGKLEHLLDPKRDRVDVMVLDMSQMINIDTTGMEALQTLHESLSKQRTRLLICAVGEQPLSLMRRSGFLSALGSDHVFDSIDQAWAAVTQGAAPAAS
jgi:sulfate permease, SulP family